ncbi:preprotein translocase subunit SecE [Neisseriaceae bacterium B1]
MTQETSQHEQPSRLPEKKGSVFTRFPKYIKDSIAEFKKVVWPKRPDAVKMTMFVIVFVAVFAVFIYGVDTAISYLFNAVLVKG